MPAPNRTVRLFVSSTFSDMAAERDLLQRQVFPRLKQLCMAKGLRFQAIDLRWGVSAEAGRHNRTMRICLRELRRCQVGPIKPNFLILLGDRYGWRPLPETVPADLFERLEHAIRTQDADTAQVLVDCYRRDNNAVPPEYVLQPRPPAFDDPQLWSAQVEAPLLAALAAAARALDLQAETIALGLGQSATHQEIIHGALAVEDAPDHVHAFLRTIRFPKDPIPHRDFVDLAPDGTVDSHAHRQCAQLRRDLEAKLGPVNAPDSNTHGYSVDWREGGQFTDADLDEFGSHVLAQLTTVIQRQSENLAGASPAELEEMAQRDYGAERCDNFRGQQRCLGRIAEYLVQGTGRPLVVLGVGGSGKSALMATAANRARASHANAVVIERYIGGSVFLTV